jgi:Cof subfamily protein (haloacid dehalogenase superfamily)
MYRLIALDIDGTLLNSQHGLSARNIAAIRTALSRGITVCLASGKLFSSARSLISELGLTGPQIHCNGAIIFEATTGDELVSWPLASDPLAAIQSSLKRHGPDIPVAWYTANHIFTTTPPGHFHDILAAYHERALVQISAFDSSLPPPLKLLVHSTPERLERLRQETEPELRGIAQVVRTSIDFLEYMSLGVTKGHGLNAVCELLNIRREECLAIGDGENDIPLVDAAGFGVAVANAVPALKEHADVIVASNDDDAVADVIERMVLV